tara:strand:- start:345 stop:1247 length:903 start_codon:yes stop_codon:yes gene_type:complete
MKTFNIKDAFENDGPIFLGSKRSFQDSSIGIFGVPYDGTSSFNPGSRFGPDAIRNVCDSLETYCPIFDTDLEEINYVDFGNLKIPFGAPEPVIDITKQAVDQLIKKGVKPLILGGEHSITIGALEALANHHSDLIMVQLDAHADLRDEWLGSKNNHACTMRRCLEKLPSKKIFQHGIRSGTRYEFEELKKKNRFIPHTTGEQATPLKDILSSYKGRPIYLTIDLDWFDPSILPGTGTPEPGGYSWHDFNEVIKVLRAHNIVGADIVELSPKLDHTEISSITAAKVARTIIMMIYCSINHL